MWASWYIHRPYIMANNSSSVDKMLGQLKTIMNEKLFNNNWQTQDGGNLSLNQDPFYNAFYSFLVILIKDRTKLSLTVNPNLTSTIAKSNEMGSIIATCAAALLTFVTLNVATAGTISVVGVAGAGTFVGGKLISKKRINERLANAHIIRIRTVCEFIISHLDQTKRIQNNAVPPQLPGQTKSEYQNDLMSYTEILERCVNTLFEQFYVLHTKFLSLQKQDSRGREFQKILDIIKKSEFLQKTRFYYVGKFLWSQKIGTSLTELDDELNAIVDDLTLLITIRTAERVQFNQLQQFGDNPPTYADTHDMRTQKLIQQMEPAALMSAFQNQR